MPVVQLTSGLERPVHVRKTVAFDGSAGNGAIGTVDVFTITGRVYIARLVAYCTENLTEGGATATIELGGATDPNAILAQINATTLDNAEWWGAVAAVAGIVTVAHPGTPGANTSALSKVTDEDIIITVGTQSVPNGTIIFDVWYEPITDDGALVAA